ncbi:MAG: iron ABC transporter permease [Beijerinckiaceae bacterium]|nr:iron ABC transporter permease [Beijerinckiaceae bacterium]
MRDDVTIPEPPKPSLLSRADWRLVAYVGLFALLIYQVALPFLMIIWTSLKTVRPGEPEFITFTFSLDNFARAFASEAFWIALRNTLVFASASTALAFVLGAFVAWAVERTNMPLAKFFGVMMIARVIIPGVLITISWILLASPNIGLLNHIVRDLFGVRNFFNIYTMAGMVWVHSIEMVPLTYLLLSASLRSMDPRLEEASTMVGAGNWRTLRRISLPLTLPAVAAALLLLFVTSIETFEVPLLMGGRAGVRLLTTEIFQSTSRTPVDFGISATYSVAMLALCILLLVAYFRLVRHGERYQTITGKDFRPRKIDLGPWRHIVGAACFLIVFCITGVPLIVMIYASLLPFYQPPGLAAVKSMSLGNYYSIFEGAQIWQPMLNSFLVGVGTATMVVLVVALIAYFVHKTEFRGRKLLDYAAFASIAIPGVVLGATFMWFYLLIPLPVIGTLLIIMLAYLTKYMPFALRFVSNSMMQIHRELDEAAQVAGVPWARNFVKVMLPLLKPGLLAAWFWVMVHAYRELTVALMLARADNRTAAVLILDYWEEGSFLKLSAFGVVMFVVLLVIVLISHRISRGYGVQEQY